MPSWSAGGRADLGVRKVLWSGVGTRCLVLDSATSVRGLSSPICKMPTGQCSDSIQLSGALSLRKRTAVPHGEEEIDSQIFSSALQLLNIEENRCSWEKMTRDEECAMEMHWARDWRPDTKFVHEARR